MSLVQAARSGEGDAKGELLERLRPRLVLWVTGQLSEALRRVAEPEDVAQDILIVVHRDLATVRAESQAEFFGWFFTVARNRLRDLAARAGALKRKLPAPVSFSQTSPSMSASRNEQAARVMSAIEQLSELDRQVILLRRIEERPAEEVARIMGRTKGSVGVVLCRALQHLGQILKQDGGNESAT